MLNDKKYALFDPKEEDCFYSPPLKRGGGYIGFGLSVILFCGRPIRPS